MTIDFLLRRYVRNGNAEALTMITTTLDAMAAGGIYDHVGGGFARYSTDAHWLVPHFEKMLYDKALLARRVPPRLPRHGNAALPRGSSRRRSTTCCATCAIPDGGFFSAEDADSRRRRRASSTSGRLDEIDEVCGDDAAR